MIGLGRQGAASGQNPYRSQTFEVGLSNREDACTILFRVTIAGMKRLLIGQFSPAGCS